MTKEIVIEYRMDPLDCKKLNIKSFKDLNGIYFYNNYKHHKQGILINVASSDFQRQHTDNGVINLFIKVDVHETIHQEVHKIIKEYLTPNTIEERFIELMAGQKRWEYES